MRQAWDWFCRCLHLLMPARFTIPVNLVLFLLLEFVEQAQDVLRTMIYSPDGGAPSFLIALFLLAAQSWYWLRFHYDNFKRESLTHTSRHAIIGAATDQTPAYVDWLPRCVGTMPFIAAAFALWKAGDGFSLFLGEVVLEALLFILLTTARRKWIHAGKQAIASGDAGALTIWLLERDKPFQRGDLHKSARMVATMALLITAFAILFSWLSIGSSPSEMSWNFAKILGGVMAAMAFSTAFSLRVPNGTRLWILFLLSVAGFSVLFAAAWPLQFAHVGTGATLVLAAAAWVGIVNLVLIFPSEMLGWPVAGVAGLLLILGLVAPSLVNSHDPGSHIVRAGDGRAEARIPLETLFKDEWVAKRKPVVVLVAAQGGASRAGYWTALALGALEDRAAQERNLDFHNSIFAMSGISGGSLGLALYQTQLRQGAKCQGHDSYGSCATAFFSQDFLAPDFARMFIVDLMQNMLSGNLLPDRAAGIEQSWEEGWKALYKGGASLDGPIDQVRKAAKEDQWLPVLLLNGTSVRSGKRIITSDAETDGVFPDTPDFFALAPYSVRLSTAAHNSARFPFISPAGTVIGEGDKPVDRIVDGGYFEGLGAQTIVDLIPKIREWSGGADYKPKIVVITLEDFTDKWRSATSDIADDLPSSMTFMSEAFSPVIGLYQTRAAHAEWAVQMLEKWPGPEEITLVRLMYRQTDERLPEPTMSWVLSAQSRSGLDKAWDAIKPDQDKVLELIAPPTVSARR